MSRITKRSSIPRGKSGHGKAKQVTAKKKTPSRVRGKKISMLPAHAAFICEQIGTFKATKPADIITAVMEEFPNYPPNKSEPMVRQWWAEKVSKQFPRDGYGRVTEECKHKEQIDAIRQEWQGRLKEKYKLANSTGRFEELLKIYDKAMEEKVVRIMSYKTLEDVDVTDSDGNVIGTERRVVYKPYPIKASDLHLAKSTLYDLAREAGDLEKTDPPPNNKITISVVPTKKEYWKEGRNKSDS